MPDWDRRRFLQLSGGVAVASVAMGVVGRLLLDNRAGGAAPEVELPTAAGPAPVRAGIAPRSTSRASRRSSCPNDEFYRIDTALVRAARRRGDLAADGPAAWSTARSTLTYDELSAMPLFEQYVTIACVSNQVGGDLVGNALWTGVDLRERARHGRRAAGRDPDRRPLGRRLHRRLPDRLGDGPVATTDDRARHERTCRCRSTTATRRA